jgi:hypothetical protein
VLLYDLVLMGTLSLGGLPAGAVAASLVANPIDAARVLGILTLEPDLYLLGPAGAYLTAAFSRGGAALILASSLLLWSSVPLLIALMTFDIRSRRPTIHDNTEPAASAARGHDDARRGDGLQLQRRPGL